MTTRISLSLPPSALEGARAAQAANRRRLAKREAEQRVRNRVQRRLQDPEATGIPLDRLRRIRLASTIKDPWRGAVPEPEPPPFVPVQVRGKRFHPVTAYWRWDPATGELRVETGDRLASASIQAPPASTQPGTGNNGVAWYQAFPAGNGRMVLLFYLTKVQYQATQTGTIEYNVMIEEVQAPARQAAQAIADAYNASQPPGSVSRIELLPTGRSFVTNDQTSTQISNVQQENRLACFVVTYDSVSVVDCPSGLESRIREKYTIYSYGIEQLVKSPTIYGKSDVDAKLYFSPTDWNPITITITQVQGPNGTQSAYTAGSIAYDAISANGINDKNYQADQATWLALLRSYGYGKLINRPDGQDPAWGWTPVIFAFLKNYKGEFHGSTEQPLAYDYAYISQQYFPYDRPKFMLESGYKVDLTDSTMYHYFLAPLMGNFKEPADFDALIVRPKEVSGPIQRRIVQVTQDQGDQSNPRPWLGGQEVPVVTWDWNRPIACILQLLDLGFTAQDLMLTTGELSALAAPDSALAGFVF